MENEKVIKAYKGFDKDLRCHGGFQYEIGKEYEEKSVKACHSGFHACERPLDVFEYFPPATSRYCEVEQSGEIDNAGDNTASSKIKIGAEIGIAGSYGAATSRGSSAVGKNGVAVARGNGVRVKGGLGALLVIAEENDSDYDVKEWIAFLVDGEDIKADTWYTLKDGELQEAPDA